MRESCRCYRPASLLRILLCLLQAAGLDILIYNGEADACVPITDNQWWTTSMNYTVAQPWTAWVAK